MYANKEQEKDREKFLDKSTGVEMDPVGEPQSLLEWFAEKYQDFGAQLEVRVYQRGGTSSPSSRSLPYMAHS